MQTATDDDTTTTTATATTAAHGIPVIDLAPFLSGSGGDRSAVVDAVREACEEFGCFAIVGHGVPADLVARMYDVTREFYLLPEADKQLAADPGGRVHIGYSGAGDYRSDVGAARPQSEVFHAYPHDTWAQAEAAGYPADAVTSLLPNIWPAAPAAFETTWWEYFRAMEGLVARLAEVFALALALPADFFADKIDRHIGHLAANHYLPQDPPPPEGTYRLRAHSDYDMMTILYQDDQPGGLQAFARRTGWVDVPHLPGSFVVNLGDLMGRWTNGRWVATPHRVRNPDPADAGTRRFSIPFFFVPNHDALVEPLPTCVDDDHPARFSPVLAGVWTRERRAGGSPNAGRIDAA